MRDIPLLILALTVSAYWTGVGVMVVRNRRRTRHDVGIVPQQPKERLMWLAWLPLVGLWIALPWLALGRAAGPWAALDATAPAHVAARWTAASIAVLCELATLRCYAWMGERWRMDVALDTTTELVTDGPFRRVRHPIYAYQALLMICSALVLATPAIVTLAAVHIALVNVKARNEERHLRATLGETYARYFESTGRFLPRFGAGGG